MKRRKKKRRYDTDASRAIARAIAIDHAFTMFLWAVLRECHTKLNFVQVKWLADRMAPKALRYIADLMVDVTKPKRQKKKVK